MTAQSTGRTPGPWEAREWHCHGPTTVGAMIDGQFQVVAECSGTGARDGQNEQEAVNARLIAAAPDLLVSLCEVMALLPSTDSPGPIRQRALAAIVRATVGK